ncbi:MAG: ATP12 family chaperone protein [Alphaproteobacteria bacterium]
MTAAKFKRFYGKVSWAAVPPGFRVLLDGRAIKTPAKAEMALPNRALAEAIAAEWQAQGEEVEVRSLVLTGLAWTAIDRVAPGRERVVIELAGFGAHDLVCYHAETPADLVARQRAQWQPLLDWAAQTLEAPLAVTSGVVSIEQPPETLAALRRAVAARDEFELTSLSAAASAAGSLVIALAFAAGRIDAATAFEAALLDESYQIERWGEDPEAARRRAAIKTDLETVARFLALLRD